MSHREHLAEQLARLKGTLPHLGGAPAIERETANRRDVGPVVQPVRQRLQGVRLDEDAGVHEEVDFSLWPQFVDEHVHRVRLAGKPDRVDCGSHAKCRQQRERSLACLVRTAVDDQDQSHAVAAGGLGYRSQAFADPRLFVSREHRDTPLWPNTSGRFVCHGSARALQLQPRPRLHLHQAG